MQQILYIEGMHCSGCANSVQNALTVLSGVQQVSVDLAQKLAKVEFIEQQVSIAQLIEAVEDAGFDVKI